MNPHSSRARVRSTVQDDVVATSRRNFLLSSAAAAATLTFAYGCDGRAVAAAATTAKAPGGKVDLVEFDNSGKRLRTVSVDRVVRSEADWRKRLSPASYDITREAGTERPYTGALLNNHARGVFRCIGCDTALYDSRTKYESHTGWPSFWQAIAPQNVRERRDTTLGMVRTEVLCPRCDAHLGHVFDDGPQPTGLRYCMNSVALTFAAA